MILQKRFVVAELSVIGFLALTLFISLIIWRMPQFPDPWPLIDLQRNWETPFIDDVEVVDAGRNCSSGYEAFGYQFEGYSPFFICQKDGIFRTENSQVDESCVKTEIPATKFSKWTNQRQICIKRLTDVTYRSIYNSINADLTCPDGFLRCGGYKLTASDPSEPFCIDSKIGRCPISAVKILTDGEVEPDMQFGNVARLKLEDGVYDLVTYRNSYSVAEVLIEESIKCSMTDKRPYIEGRPRFTFDKADKTSCPKNEDSRYSNAGRVLEENYFRANLPSYIDSLINVQAVTNTWAYFLLNRRTIGYSVQCKDKFPQVLEFRTKSEQANKNFSYVRTIVWSALILLVLIIALQVVSYIKAKSIYWHVRTLATFAIVLVLFFGLLFMIIKVSFSRDLDNQALGEPCFQKSTADLLRPVVEYNQAISFFPLVLMFILVLLSGLAFAIVTYVQWNYYLRMISREGVALNRETTYGELESSFNWLSPASKKREVEHHKDTDVYKDNDKGTDLNWI